MKKILLKLSAVLLLLSVTLSIFAASTPAANDGKWYFVKSQRYGSGGPWWTIGTSTVTPAALTKSNSQKFTLISLAGGKVGIQAYGTNGTDGLKLSADGSAGTWKASGAATGWTLTSNVVNTIQGYAFSGENQGIHQGGGGWSWRVGTGYYSLTDNCTFFFYEATADAELRIAIDDATVKLNSVTVGTKMGQISQTDWNNYQSAINTAKTFIGSTDNTVIQTAITNLNTAATTFTNSIVPATRFTVNGNYVIKVIDGGVNNNRYLVHDGSNASNYVPTTADITKASIWSMSFSNKGYAAPVDGIVSNLNVKDSTSRFLDYQALCKNVTPFVSANSNSFVIWMDGSTAQPNSRFAIQSNGKFFLPYTSAGDYKVGFSTSTALDATRFLFSITDYNTAVKAALNTTITNANTLKTNTVEGTDFGQFTTANRTALQSAIDAAQVVYNNASATDAEITNAITVLNNAITTYKGTINTDKNILISTDETKYKWYSIRSTASHAYVAGKVISSNGRVLSNKFTFENPGTPVTDAQLFRFELSDNDVIIINKANGYYMAADGAIKTNSATFALNLLTDGYSFNIKPADANAIHAQDAGSHIVNWAGNAGSASAWVFDYQKTTPKVPEFSGTGNWSNAANWVDNALPDAYNDVIINGAGEAVLDVDASYNSITINSGKSLSVAPGKGLTIGGTLINNGTLTLQSDATGTATILSPATITSGTGAVYNVQQYLTGNADNSARQWWYVSSPVSSAKSSVFDPAGTNNMGYYDETLATPAFVQFTANDQDLMVGTGYVTQLKSTGTFTFTGGTLNNGDINLTPTRTGIDAAKRGFNLVGNPYPSYLNWDAAYTDTQNPQSNMRNAIWYRTYSGGAMVFHTYANEESVPLGANGMIPPMQAFWVKVKADGSNGSITFKNAYRSHATGSTFPLKAKAMTKTQRLRLLVSNGTNTDETLIVGKSYASAAYDEYDTEKMSNNNAAIPEIYSIAESQELVINSVNQLAEGETIPLGLRPGQAGSFSIEATQLDNIDAQVVLVDKLTGAKTELTAGISYHFTTDGTATNNRFSIEFRAPGMTTGLDNSDFADFNITVYSGKIQIQSPAMANGELIRVYSSNGQKIIEQTAEANSTIIDHKLSSGVYFVKVSNYVQKIIIH